MSSDNSPNTTMSRQNIIQLSSWFKFFNFLIIVVLYLGSSGLESGRGGHHHRPGPFRHVQYSVFWMTPFKHPQKMEKYDREMSSLFCSSVSSLYLVSFTVLSASVSPLFPNKYDTGVSYFILQFITLVGKFTRNKTERVKNKYFNHCIYLLIN